MIAAIRIKRRISLSAALLIFISVFVLTSGFGCRGSGEVANFKPIALEYWGVFEEPGDISLLTRSYTRRHPKITIGYRTFREEEYKQKLLEAWALGTGPDMFMIPATRIKEFLRFIEPMPAIMKAPSEYEEGTIKKQRVTKMLTYNGYTPRQVRDTFLDVVYDDVVINDKVYALPYSVDTLSVFYNRELLRANNIPLPAKNWAELLEQASKISKVDSEDNLVESTIALGTTNNIPGALDIISTIMMQVGIPIANSAGPLFHQGTSLKETLNAIQFFLSFSQKGVKNYSWNGELPDALDVFTAGKLAYFLGYSYHADLIRERNPKLDWDVIPLFKPEGVDITPTYANYWVTVVSKPPQRAPAETRQRAELAWQYLLEATQQGNVKAYLNNPRNPRTTALRALVTEQQRDQRLGPFANNLLNARSWYRGYNAQLAQTYFLEMIEKIREELANGLSPEQHIQIGASLISQTYQAPR